MMIYYCYFMLPQPQLLIIIDISWSLPWDYTTDAINFVEHFIEACGLPKSSGCQ